MKCFEVTADTCAPGLPIALSEGLVPLVRVACSEALPEPGIKNAFIAKELSEKLMAAELDRDGYFGFNAPRLLRCDIELRSEVWLTPESEATKDEVLVVLSYAKYTTRSKVTFIGQGDGAEILHQNNIVRPHPLAGGKYPGFDYYPGYVGKAVLARLSVGCKIVAEVSIVEPVPRKEWTLHKKVIGAVIDKDLLDVKRTRIERHEVTALAGGKIDVVRTGLVA